MYGIQLGQSKDKNMRKFDKFSPYQMKVYARIGPLIVIVYGYSCIVYQLKGK